MNEPNLPKFLLNSRMFRQMQDGTNGLTSMIEIREADGAG